MATSNTNNAVPPIWPVEARIRKSGANMEPFIIAAMQLVEQIRPRIEVGRRNSTSIQNWTEWSRSWDNTPFGFYLGPVTTVNKVDYFCEFRIMNIN